MGGALSSASSVSEAMVVEGGTTSGGGETSSSSPTATGGGGGPVAGPSGMQAQASTSKGLFTSPKKAFMMREAANRESGGEGG